jgi:hypothetical protein
MSDNRAGRATSYRQVWVRCVKDPWGKVYKKERGSCPTLDRLVDQKVFERFDPRLPPR